MTEDAHPTTRIVPGPLFPPELRKQSPADACAYCNGTGTKNWGKLGVRACVHCKGTGKARKR